MTPPRARLLSLSLVLCSLLPATAWARKPAPEPNHWVGTWATAVMALPNRPDTVVDAPDTTYREIVHVSLGGDRTRITLSNEFGTDPLRIGEVHIALASANGSISLVSANALTFSGHPAFTIPPGAVAVSDPVALKLPPFSDLAITVFVPAQTIHQVSGHIAAHQVNYVSPGNSVNLVQLPSPKEVTSWSFLKSVEVEGTAGSAAVVCLGDSITDGTHSTDSANRRWPDIFALRLSKNKGTKDLAVLNMGIGGNRVLRDGVGPSALARFDRDVLAQSSVKYLVFLESINDIGTSEGPKNPSHAATAESLIAGLTQIAERAHLHGIRVIGATLTPYMGAGYSSPAGEAIRQAVNQWIRTSTQLDGVLDFDRATQDKSNPSTMAPSADSGDHLHPNDTGYKAMADSINLNLFTPHPKEKFDITRQP